MLTKDLVGLFNKACFYLKFRPRTTWEMRQYLYKKIKTTHWSTADVEKVIKHLKTIGVLDDEKFIDAFVQARKLHRPRGKRLLIKELLSFGIDKDLIEKYFANTEIDEMTLAHNLLSRRWLRWKKLSPPDRNQKAAQFLLRRGFNFDLVNQIIKLFASKN